MKTLNTIWLSCIAVMLFATLSARAQLPTTSAEGYPFTLSVPNTETYKVPAGVTTLTVYTLSNWRSQHYTAGAGSGVLNESTAVLTLPSNGSGTQYIGTIYQVGRGSSDDGSDDYEWDTIVYVEWGAPTATETWSWVEDYRGPWTPTSAWSPDASGTPADQQVLQTRSRIRTIYGHETSNLGNNRNYDSPMGTETGTETQTVQGTGTVAHAVTFTFSNLIFTYDGSVKSAVVTPSDPAATWTVFSGSISGTNAGSYPFAVQATGIYTGSGSATLVINPAVVSFSFGNLGFTYDGAAKGTSVTVNGWSGPGSVTFTSNLVGGPDAGNWPVFATANGNFTGTTSQTLVIARLPQVISAIDPAPFVLGYPGSIDLASSASSNMGQALTFNVVSGSGYVGGSTLTPTNAGYITVTASQAGTTNYLPATSANFRVTVLPRIDGATGTPLTPSISVTPSTTNFVFGDSSAISFSAVNVSSVSVTGNGAPGGNVTSPFVVSPTDGGVYPYTVTAQPLASAYDVAVTTTGATSVKITDGGGGAAEYAVGAPIRVPATGTYSITAIFRSGSDYLDNSWLGGTHNPTTLSASGVSAASSNFTLGVRPRIDAFSVSAPAAPLSAPGSSISVTPTTPLPPFTDLTAPANVTVSWNAPAAGSVSVSGPLIATQASSSGSTSVVLSLASLSSTTDGTYTYQLQANPGKGSSTWASSGATSLGTALLESSADNVSFSPVSSGLPSGSAGNLDSAWYRVRVTNAAGDTISSSSQIATIASSTLTASIQPKINLIVASINPALGSVSSPGGSYVYNTRSGSFTATATTGAQFTVFTGDTAGATSITHNVAGATSGTISGVLMDKPKAIAANFDYKVFDAVAIMTGQQGSYVPGTIAVTGSIPYTDYFGRTGNRAGSNVTVIYTPRLSPLGNPTYSVQSWTDNGTIIPNVSDGLTISLVGAGAVNHNISVNLAWLSYSLSLAVTIDGATTVDYWRQDGTKTSMSATGTVTQSPMAASYEVDTTVNLTAMPTTFDGFSVIESVTWSGAGVSSSSLDPFAASVTMSTNRNVVATLHPKKPQSIAWTGTGAAFVGEIVKVDAILDSGEDPVVTFDSGGSLAAYDAVKKEITFTGVGPIVIRLWHAGNASYLPAQPQTYTVNVLARVRATVKEDTAVRVNNGSGSSSHQIITIPPP